MDVHFASAWEEVADLFPHRKAAICDGKSITWNQFERKAGQIASLLIAHGLGKDSKIALYLHNSNEYLEASFGAFKIEGCPINVNYRYKAEELVYLLDSSDSEAVFFQSRYAMRIWEIKDRLSKVKVFVQIDDGTEALLKGAIDYDRSIRSLEPLPRQARDLKGKYILYTGGTAGMPKGVVYEVGPFAGRFLDMIAADIGVEPPNNLEEYRKILLNGYPVQTTVEGNELVTKDGRSIDINEAQHLPPTQPSKIICVHLNYESRVKEYITKLPPAPTYFHKPVTALNSHNGDIVRPERCKWLNYEGEIAIVIGRNCRNISPEEAKDYIAGYTVANDYGLHDFRDTDAGSMLRVKGSDTLCPVGPGLVTGWDFHNKGIRTIVNGKVMQDANTNEMEWDMNYLVADIARNITLEPGDLLLSGTPANSRPVNPGDIVEVEVEGLGILSNKIVHGAIPIRDDVGAQPSSSEEVISTAMGGDWEFRGQRAAGGQGAKFYKSSLKKK